MPNHDHTEQVEPAPSALLNTDRVMPFELVPRVNRECSLLPIAADEAPRVPPVKLCAYVLTTRCGIERVPDSRSESLAALTEGFLAQRQRQRERMWERVGEIGETERAIVEPGQTADRLRAGFEEDVEVEPEHLRLST